MGLHLLGRPDTILARERQLAAEGSTRAARSTGPEGGAAGALARQVELLFPPRAQEP
jgi:hypothetical protein